MSEEVSETPVPAPPKPFVKEFDSWNKEKKWIESKPLSKRLNAKINEVWHFKFWVNSGTEICWKDAFLRPAMVINTFKDGYFVAPLTTKDGGNNVLRYPIQKWKLAENGSCVLLCQARYVSWERLVKRVNTNLDVDEAVFISKLVMRTLFPMAKNTPDSIAGFGVRSFEEEASED